MSAAFLCAIPAYGVLDKFYICKWGDSLVPRLHSPAEKSWGVEPGNEAKWAIYISSPVVEAGEGVLEFLSTGALGHAPEAGAVPVDLSAGKNDAVLVVLGKGVHHLRVSRVLLRHKDGDILAWSRTIS